MFDYGRREQTVHIVLVEKGTRRCVTRLLRDGDVYAQFRGARILVMEVDGRRIKNDLEKADHVYVEAALRRIWHRGSLANVHFFRGVELLTLLDDNIPPSSLEAAR